MASPKCLTLRARGAFEVWESNTTPRSLTMKPKHKLPPWLRPKGGQAGVHVGVSWYTAENWEKVKASAKDAELLEATFDEWQAMAQNSLRELSARGIRAEKVYIDAGEFLSWCLAKNASNEAPSRAQFVSAKMSKAGDTNA